MRFPALERLSEIQHLLRDIIEPLGIQARLGNRFGIPSASPEIELRSEDGNIFSPVSIDLAKPALKVRNPSWEHSLLFSGGVATEKLGNNGWTFRKTYPPSYSALPGETARAHQMIRNSVKRDGVVHRLPQPTITVDEDFAKGYSHLQAALYDIGEPEILCERNEGIESYNFVDQQDRQWRVAWELENIVVYVDEERIRAFERKDDQRMAEWVERAVFSLRDKKRDDKAPDPKCGR